MSRGASVFTGDGEGNFSAQRQGRYADWMGLTAINPDPMNQQSTPTP